MNETDEQLNRVEVYRGFRGAIVWLLALLLNLWGRTLRFDCSTELKTLLATREPPLLILMWHNRLFVSAEIRRRFRKGFPISALISASKDGGLLSTFFHHMGIDSVRGSSSRRGSAALRALVTVLRKRQDIAITPDGPRGPAYVFKQGSAWVPAKMQCPVLILMPQFCKYIRVGSWDRFFIPLPFSRVKLDHELIFPEDEVVLDPENLEDLTALLQEKMMNLTQDSLFPATQKKG
jgi:lysophospholipid acyltransferase (LPLAT)-like uncharacterized protein